MRCPRRIASRRRSPAPGSVQRDTRPASSGRFSRNHSRRCLNSGSFSSSSGSIVVTAKSGISPTIERIFSGTAWPSGVRRTS